YEMESRCSSSSGRSRAQPELSARKMNAARRRPRGVRALELTSLELPLLLHFPGALQAALLALGRLPAVVGLRRAPLELAFLEVLPSARHVRVSFDGGEKLARAGVSVKLQVAAFAGEPRIATPTRFIQAISSSAMGPRSSAARASSSCS